MPDILREMRSEEALYGMVRAVYGPEQTPCMMDRILMRRIDSNRKIDEIVTAMWPEVLRVVEKW